MAALAGLFHAAGYRVTGADLQCYPPMSTQLEARNINVANTYTAENLSPLPDLVVIGNAISADNPEATAVRARKIPFLSMADALAGHFCADRFPILVTGTHGKTTMSSLVAWLLEHAGRSPSFFIGGVPKNFGHSSQLGTGTDIVIEADEYDTAFFDKTPKFLHYPAKAVILGAVEFDHADIYADLAAVLAAFRALVDQLPPDTHLIAATQHANVATLAQHATCAVTPFVMPTHIQHGPEETRFRLLGTPFRTQLSGSYNLQNIAGAVTLLHTIGLDLQTLARGVESFTGVARRQDVVGTVADITVMDDFAHHPTAVRETLTGLAQRFPDRKLHVGFEPRSNTSGRQIFFADYVEAFSAATSVALGPIFKRDRIPSDALLDRASLAQALNERTVDASATETYPATADFLIQHAQPGDMIILMSNGDFGGIHAMVLNQLQQRHNEATTQ
jgi:UDP-N-acetylmuramate: L-alanyl-gamma-D-glutamyl-meso-diaminopimelate ligase